MEKHFSVKIGNRWRVSNTCHWAASCGVLQHRSEATASARCERANALELAGEVSPAALIKIRRNLVLSRTEFARNLHIAVRTLEDYEQAKRRISPAVYELAKRIGADHERNN